MPRGWPASARPRRTGIFATATNCCPRIAQRGFEQFEALLTQAWDDGRPDTVTAFERVGKAYLAFARNEPAFYSAMFESGLPVDANPTLMAASERAFAIIRAAAERLAALAPPGVPRPPAMMMALHIWSMSHGVASLFGRGDAARRKLPMSPEELLEAEVLIYLRGLGFPTDRRPADQKPRRPAAGAAGRRPPALGAPPNKFSGLRAGRPLDKNAGWFRYVNVIYIHNGVIAVMEREMAYTADVNRWRGPAPKRTTARICSIALAPRLDRRDHPRLHHLVADRPCPSLFHTREQKNGLLESTRIAGRTRWSGCSTRWSGCAAAWSAAASASAGPPSSGNRAFDEYRVETLQRLEEEQVEFKNFLDRLRHAKDKEEFDQFMAQHKPRPTPPNDQPQS